MAQTLADVPESLAKNRSTRISKPNSRFFSEDIQVQMPLKRTNRKRNSSGESQDDDQLDVKSNTMEFNCQLSTSNLNESIEPSSNAMQTKIKVEQPNFESTNGPQSPKSLQLNDTSLSSPTTTLPTVQTPCNIQQTVVRKRGRPPSAKTLAKRMQEQSESFKVNHDNSVNSFQFNEDNSNDVRGKSSMEDESTSLSSSDDDDDDDEDDSRSYSESGRQRRLRGRRPQIERVQPIQKRRRGRPSLAAKEETLLNSLLVRPLTKNGKLIGRPRKRVPVDDVINALSRNPSILGSKGKCNCNQSFEVILKKLDEMHKDQLEKCRLELEEREKEKFELEVKLEEMNQECEELRNKICEQKSDSQLYQKLCELRREHALEISRVKRLHWCFVCEKQADYYCCWNTSYCSTECQCKHWHAGHKNRCLRRKKQST